MDISAVEICNLALGMLGEKKTITSFDQGPGLPVILKRAYPLCRNEVLEAHEWNCAIERKDLAQLEDEPVSGFSYQYQLPVSPLCLKVLEMTNVKGAAYRVEGDRLLTDESECSIRYIKEVTDTTKYSPSLANLIARKVAEKVAFTVTQDKSKESEMKAAYEYELNVAKGIDNMAGQQPDPEENNSWTEAGRS